MIEWEDAQHVNTRWAPLDYVASERFPLAVKSVGWLVSDTDEAKVIVPHISGGDGIRECGTGDMCIPSKGILKMTVLKG